MPSCGAGADGGGGRRTDHAVADMITVTVNEPVTLRWVLMHLIEETTRHNGRIDILREMADCATGR